MVEPDSTTMPAHRLRFWRGGVSCAVLVAALVLSGASRPAAHEIPLDVLVQAFFKPEGQRLRLLVRVPLSTLRDVQFPTRGPGFLQLLRADPFLRDGAKIWLSDSITVYENERPLGAPEIQALQVSLPSDRSFTSYDEALAHVMGPPLPAETELIWNQGLLDVLFEFPIASDRSEFAIHPSFARLGIRVVTVLRFLPPTGGVRAFEYRGDAGIVRLDPRWYHAAWRFVQLGFEHILSGVDHLLFLFCLVIPYRRLGQLVLIVTAFTVAHSITLMSAALNVPPDALWFPPLIETLIAASIVYMALENIVGVKSTERRWIITFAFGLVHGFGFSFALRETLQFAGSHLLTSLVSFNVGVELGQIAVLIVMVPVLHVLFRYVVAERVGAIILSALAAHTAWHWLSDRFERLRQFSWPALDAATLASALRWAMVVVVVVGVMWLVKSRRRGADVGRGFSPGARRP